MAKYVVGNYTNATEAQNMVSNLIGKGYPVDSLSLIADKDMATGLDATGVEVVSGDEGVWDRIKGFFGSDEYGEEHSVLSAYRRDIRNGNVLVVVEDTLVPASLKTDVDTQYAQQPAEHHHMHKEHEENAQTMNKDDETLRLQEERLNVDKESVESGEVVLKKRVVEENQTIDVPVRHEELVVERRPVSERQAGTDSFEDETISIPLMEEQVHVTKEPVVTEEVRVRKRDVEDTKQVSASVRKEELDVEKTGNVVVQGGNPGQSTSAPPM